MPFPSGTLLSPLVHDEKSQCYPVRLLGASYPNNAPNLTLPMSYIYFVHDSHAAGILLQ